MSSADVETRAAALLRAALAGCGMKVANANAAEAQATTARFVELLSRWRA